MTTIRRATNYDIQTIQGLAGNIWTETYREILSLEQLDYMFDMMYSTSSLDKQITNDTFLLIYDNKNLIAYISISKEDDRSFTIQKLYVSTEVQGRGIGRFAIDAGVKYIKDLFDVDEISLSLFVNRSNKAVEFYKKMTFEIVAERDFHIGNDYYMNDYIMKRVY